MIVGKGGVLGESVMNVIRLILISFIALIILGTSAIFYNYYIDVKDTEAFLISSKVIGCVVSGGVVDISRFDGFENNLLQFCGFENTDRFFARVTFENNSLILKQGDEGLLWTKPEDSDSFSERKGTFSGTKYESGYYRTRQGVKVVDGFESTSDSLIVEVLVKHEF